MSSTLVAAAGPVIPSFGAPSSYACERANRIFCWDWVRKNWGSVLWPAVEQHIALTLIAVGIGFAIAFSLALLAHRFRHVERPVIFVTTVFYTIPALALFELLVPVPGLGLSRATAEVALVSYTLLILFRNTLAGLRQAPVEVLEAARGMGMTSRQLLLRVELPLALPTIVAGLRIATVSTIALATIAALVADQGLGVPILAAIGDSVFKTELLSAGLLAIAMAIAADAALVGVQRLITPWARARVS
jgi:osmoprotectant transport system permease protein